jgi:hypothetical protein
MEKLTVMKLEMDSFKYKWWEEAWMDVMSEEKNQGGADSGI